MFRAFCKEDDGWFFYVKVYPSKKLMQAGLRRAFLSAKCDAMCADHIHQTWDGKRMKTELDIGCLYFHHDSMRVGVICHEAFHAAIAWHRLTREVKVLKLSRERGGNVGKHEEDVAWVAGNIARQIVLNYKRKK